MNHETNDAGARVGGDRRPGSMAGMAALLRRLLPPYPPIPPAEVLRQQRKALGWTAPLWRLLPPHHDRPPVPPGYVGLSHAWKEVYRWAGRWGVPLGWGDVRLRTAVAERLGQAAAHGLIEVAGIDVLTGDAYRLPREVWLTAVLAGGQVSSPAHFACRGGLVRLPPPRAHVLCRAVVSSHDLAVTMGAFEPPPRPGPEVLATVPLPAPVDRRNGAPVNRKCAGDGGGAGPGRGEPLIAEAATGPVAPGPGEAGSGTDAGPEPSDCRGGALIEVASSDAVAPEPIGTVPSASVEKISGRPDQAIGDGSHDGMIPGPGDAVEFEADDWDAGGSNPAPNGGYRDAPATGILTYRTGAPGQPTSKPLVEDQMRRHARDGTMCGSLTREADVLAAWLPKAHPLAARMTPKSVRNQLCDVYRELDRARKVRPE